MPGEPSALRQTVGIVGFGAIGQNVAALLKGFGCPILYTQTHAALPAAEEQTLGVAYAATDDLLAKSDVVSLHCPLTPRNDQHDRHGGARRA